MTSVLFPMLKNSLEGLDKLVSRFRLAGVGEEERASSNPKKGQLAFNAEIKIYPLNKRHFSLLSLKFVIPHQLWE